VGDLVEFKMLLGCEGQQRGGLQDVFFPLRLCGLLINELTNRATGLAYTPTGI
jgi:hypothetical protein